MNREKTAASGGLRNEEFLLRLRGEEAARFIDRAGGDKPITLDDSGKVWVLCAGKADVFLVRPEEGQAAGPRTHLFRAETGEALFGLEQPDGGNAQIVAVGVADASLVEFERSLLGELADDHRSEVAALLDGWVQNLYGALRAETRPKEFVTLTPGAEISLNAPMAVRAESGVVWVRHRGGGLSLSGYPGLPLTFAEPFFPLAARAYLDTEPGTTLLGLDTEDFLVHVDSWPSLDAFHAMVLAVLIEDARQESSERRERLLLRAEADQRLREGAALQLASVLEEKNRATVVPATTVDPLLAACRMVGGALRVELRAPERPAGDEARDPLDDISRASRVRTRRVALREGWWRRDGGPLLGFKDASPVALLPKGPKTYEIVDPTEGTRRKVTEAVAEGLSPFAYVFYPPLPDREVGVRDLLRFILRNVRRDLLTVLLVGVAAGLLGMLVPIAAKAVVETAIPQGEGGLLVALALGLAAAAVAGMLFQTVSSFAVLRIETKMDSSLQAAVWDRLLRLPASFFRKYSTGDLAMRALGINTIRQMITGATISSLLSSVFSLFSFGLIFYYSATLGLIAAFMAAIIIGVTVAGSYLQLRYQRETTEVLGKVTSLVLQLLGGVAKLRVAGAETRAFAVWAGLFSTQKTLSSKAQSAANLLTVFNSVSGLLTSLVIFAVVGLSSLADLSTGDFVAFNTAFAQFLFASTGITSSFTTILQAAPYYERAVPILRTLPEVDEGKMDPGELSGKVELNQVYFRYGSDDPLVLDGVSLKAEPGEFVAIVGPSGAGKSSLFRILLGFENPESGSIYYDEQDLASLDLSAVRRQMGVVLQNGRLMSGTIFGNIVGSAALTMEDAWEAARLAGLDADIKAMPMGMYTFLSEGASTISGGQRQRLMIARAIAAKPRILLFDEATSALDNRTQALVSESLENLLATRIVIAHRLSTIINADRIYVLEAGRVVQVGTYAELMDREGPFRELAVRQLA